MNAKMRSVSFLVQNILNGNFFFFSFFLQFFFKNFQKIFFWRTVGVGVHLGEMVGGSVAKLGRWLLCLRLFYFTTIE
jgi:hypothetical protein